MGDTVDCPHCEKEVTIEDAYEHDEDSLIEVECPHCGLKFQASYFLARNFTTFPANCLNDGKHDWKPRIGFPEEYFINKVACSQCGEEKTDPELWAALQKKESPIPLS